MQTSDSPVSSMSPSPTSKFNSHENKKRPLEEEFPFDDEGFDKEVVEETVTKAKKFFNIRDKTDRETENGTDRATILFDNLQRGNEETSPGQQSLDSQNSYPNSTPKKYENTRAKMPFTARRGLGCSLQGSASEIPAKVKDPTHNHHGSNLGMIPQKPSPYFTAKKSPQTFSFKKSKTPSLLATNYNYGTAAKRLSLTTHRTALSPLSTNSAANKIGSSSSYNSRISSDTQRSNGNDENFSLKILEDDDPFYSPKKDDGKSEDETEFIMDKIILPHKIGFRNYGNTCYMNSTIQILLGLKPFCWDVQAELSAMSVHLSALQAVIKFADQGKQDSAMGALKMLRDNFIRHINEEFRGYKQQDASEFFALFLTHIDEDITRVRNRYFKGMFKEGSNTLIGDNFEVCTAEKNTCKHCEKVREDKQKHLQLFVSLPEKEKQTYEDEFSLQQVRCTSSIQSLLGEQMLGSHQNKCTNCESEEGCCTTKLTVLPRILLVQLKRYNNKSEKIKTPTKISPFVVLDKYVADNCIGPKPIRMPQENKTTQTYEEEVDDDIKRALELSLQESRSEENSYKEIMAQSLLEEVSSENWSDDDAKNIWTAPSNVKHCYRLVGIMLHGGEDTGNGHYSAHVYRSDAHKWMYYSDSYLHDLHTKEIFELRTQKDCYLLAYMHKDVFDATEALMQV